MSVSMSASTLVADTLNDNEVAVLCDIGQISVEPRGAKAATVQRLIRDGFVEPDSEAPRTQPARYRLSRKGQEALTERGVGINEA